MTTKSLMFTLLCTSMLLGAGSVRAQSSLRSKIGQMVMVTVTGDSVEESSPSMDTLKSDLQQGRIGGVIMFTWSGNLLSPGQIVHFTSELQRRAGIPLFLAIDEEGGRVARLGPNNGFAATPSAYNLGTILNAEASTRSAAATMAGWMEQTGLTMNFAPVADVNVNPSSPAIGALQRSFSADPAVVARHAGWFIDEFHKKGILTTLKHFPGHGSATADSHLGFTDITDTWSPAELEPYTRLIGERVVDAVMTGHLFNAAIDSLYPATLSPAAITGLLRTQLGFRGVVISDEMSMKAISGKYGLDEAMILAVKAGVDILLYNANLDSSGKSLARRVVGVVEQAVLSGDIPLSRIEESYDRIMTLKGLHLSTVAFRADPGAATEPVVMNYPNPFNGATTIGVQLPRGGQVRVTIFDMLGRQVGAIGGGEFSPGYHEVHWNAAGMASGLYLCRLTMPGGIVKTLRMILMK